MAKQHHPLDANRKALVMGNDSYKAVTKLENAREDARLMAKSLSNVGYQVTMKLDLTEKEMKAALRGFKNQVEAGDEVAIFYAGHGVQIGGASYLMPTDIQLNNEQNVQLRAYPLRRLLDEVSAAPSAVNIVILDACRDNPFAEKASGKGLAQLDAPPGTYLAFATSPGNVAEDG